MTSCLLLNVCLLHVFRMIVYETASINKNRFSLSQVFPFVYVLMTNKTEKCYEHVFRYINENVFDLNCTTFTTDYEVAMRNAIRNIYPRSNQIACYFHFTQAVKKNAWKTTGLVDLIRSNSAARSVYYRLQCIPLLPPQYIANMFTLLKAEANKIERAVFRPFLKYYHQQWIVKVNNGVFLF